MSVRTPLDQLISRVASPVVKDLGFKRSGHWFTSRVSPDDLATISFHSFRLGERDVEMFVERTLHVREHYDARGWPWPDGPGFGLWSRRVEDPAKTASNVEKFDNYSKHDRADLLEGTKSPDAVVALPKPAMPDLWQIDLDDAREIERFAQTLREAAQELLAMADRSQLTSWLEARQGEFDNNLAMPVSEALSLLRAAGG